MANLSTTYLGLELKNPFIVGSSGLTATYEGIARLAKNGAAAVVLKSIFEEEIQMEFREALKNQLGPQDNNLDFLDYLDYQIKADVLSKTTELIRRVKADFDLKVIASIHCRSVGEWFAYAAKLQEAGADALELNIYRLPSALEVSAAEIAEGNERIVEKVMKHVRIPVSVKMSAYTTDVAYTAQRYAQLGVKGLVLFNRFTSPISIWRTIGLWGDRFTLIRPTTPGLCVGFLFWRRRWRSIWRPATGCIRPILR